MSTAASEKVTASAEAPSGGSDLDALNVLLRAELSAVETYDKALTTFEENMDARAELNRLHREHLDAASSLREIVTRLGGTPSEGSGPWGTFASAITTAAKLIGPDTVLASLKQGEERGITAYEAALANEKVAEECKALIRSTLLPRCREHLATLDRVRMMV